MRARRPVPDSRVRVLIDRPPRAGAEFVLYWMIASRRAGWNFGLQRAVDWASALRKPLVVLEGLRVGHPSANDRLHRFVLDGMADNVRRFAATPALYWPYVEPEAGRGHGLLEALAEQSAVVVTDDYPCYFLPRMVEAASRRLAVRFEQIDGNGVLPMRAAGRTFVSAYQFRRYYQQTVHAEGYQLPLADSFEGVSLPHLSSLPAEVVRRWPAAEASLLSGDATALAALPIDHTVPAVSRRGGTVAGRAQLNRFVRERLGEYGSLSHQPEAQRSSELSPHLHFGHLSAHEVFDAAMRADGGELDTDAPRRARGSNASHGRRAVPPATADGGAAVGKPTGQRHGFWGVNESTEIFIDELLTWRELGFNMCAMRSDYDRYESLPAWAQRTLDKHAADSRPRLYDRAALEHAHTHDRLWNAIQTQLVRDGWFPNYLRMLWAKKILEWSPHPREALTVMMSLMDRYALDGRDPNSYTGYFWTLGRYDRPWAPERPIFGTVRYMSSDSTLRKLKLKTYLATYAPGDSPGLF